jgi:AraC-like DNA-binding protein
MILASDDLSAHPLLLDSAIRHLSVVTLDAFSATMQPRDRNAPASIVRRATRYIDNHLAEPIVVHDIAAASRVSVRTLQSAFRATRDETPMGYLQRARLDAARRTLTHADPATATVADIARRWGFTSPGRFAAAYRQAYGQNPSRHLHQ